MNLDLSNALKVYLGADEDGGFQPIYCEKRLRAAFPSDYSRVIDLINPYLSEYQEPDWSNGDLVQETKRFASTLEKKFPELDTIAIRALANRWSYAWK